MPAYYRASLKAFAGAPASEIDSTLTEQNAHSSFRLEPEALFAWKFQLAPLQEAARWLLEHEPDADEWSILLDYPIQRIGKRIDDVLLARNVIVVIET